MPDVCEQTFVEISPELANIFRRHFDRDYMLSWYIGIIRRYLNRDRIKEEIRKRYLRGMEEHEYRYGPTKGAKKFRLGTAEFLNDFDTLSFADIDILTQMNPYETVDKPIKTIDGKPIKLMEE